MRRDGRESRAEIVIRGWFEGESKGEYGYRGSISNLNGGPVRQFIGMVQLVARLTEILREAGHSEANR
ncbi:hypothetical protein [Puniceibacterium sediminis]|uniref:Uncharacterized protein n=1 Tax=Puniceibacterium sediminis TaxID=1608407 RepID=A0A238Z3B2_9RHOB|nr:hypothetical protein [Puniceibacterium sediminis]SNR77866.1 hypothetical protein SAMN06265370_12324 [Puniceibacterium sediminis]